MKNKLHQSELGISFIEVIVSMSIILATIYYTLTFDFHTPRKNIEVLQDVDHSFKEIAGLLSDKRICNATFKDENFTKSLMLDEIKARKCNPCTYTRNNNKAKYCEECNGEWCMKNDCAIYIYGTYRKYKTSPSRYTLYTVNDNKINARRSPSTTILDSMELKDFVERSIGGASPNKKEGYANLILTYTLGSLGKVEERKRKIPIFINLENDKIESCSLSPTHCLSKEIEPNKGTCPNGITENFVLPKSETGTELRRIIQNASDKTSTCACIGSFFCYNGYWSYPPPLCFNDKKTIK